MLGWQFQNPIFLKSLSSLDYFSNDYSSEGYSYVPNFTDLVQIENEKVDLTSQDVKDLSKLFNEVIITINDLKDRPTQLFSDEGKTEFLKNIAHNISEIYAPDFEPVESDLILELSVF